MLLWFLSSGHYLVQAFLAMCVAVCAATYNHQWWTCSESCRRCLRQATPVEELIQQLYPGLFSATPPDDVHYKNSRHSRTQSKGVPVQQESLGVRLSSELRKPVYMETLTRLEKIILLDIGYGNNFEICDVI